MSLFQQSCSRLLDAGGVARTAVRRAPSLDSARAILGIALFQQRQYTGEALRYPSGAVICVTLRYQLANRAVMLSPTVEESSRASFDHGTGAS